MAVQLSKRMQAVVGLVKPGYVVADVGCDHGFVSIYLVQAGLCPHVYAADVRPGPLQRAEEHIAQAGLSAYITPVLSDGLAKVPVEGAAENGAPSQRGANAMIAAGIGGKLTVRILSEQMEKTKRLFWLVLEPQSEIWLVRRWLRENRFFLTEERMVWEDGKYYPVLCAVNERMAGADAELQRRLSQQEAALLRWQGLGKKEGAYTRARWEAACDRYGSCGILSGDEVLQAFLSHTIETDSGLLARLLSQEARPEGEGAQAGDAGGQRRRERIAGRRAELEERILLARLVLSYMKTGRDADEVL